MLKRLAVIACVGLFAFGEMGASIALAQDTTQQQQQPKRRNLFDFLFGGGDQQDQTPTPPPAPVVTKPRKGVLPAIAKPAIAKAATATRLMVFGDTMAVDLAAALDRFYQDDPNIVVINQGVSASGFARPDFFDWDKTATDQVTKNSFDIAVMFVGTNDRQSIRLDGNTLKPLTTDWTSAYQSRVHDFVAAIHGANKPIIWVGLPPMGKADVSEAMGQISADQRLAAFAAGGDFVDIYDKFVDDSGNYTPSGPDLNGNQVKMRRDDGVRFTAAGADKLAFYVSQTLKLYYHGSGAVGLTVADALAGTDAALMVRPPYQGLGQTRLLEVAGAVIPLSQTAKPAADLVQAGAPSTGAAFDASQMLEAPKGRVDDFGVGVTPTEPVAAGTGVGTAASVANR